MRHVRQMDRRLHFSTYPELFFPECYLIDRGYRHVRAHKKTASLCFPTPGAYLSMNDEGCISKGLCKRCVRKPLLTAPPTSILIKNGTLQRNAQSERKAQARLAKVPAGV